MKKLSVQIVWVMLVLMAVGLSACSSQTGAVQGVSVTPTTAQPAASATFTDPFAYCASVGTLDTPDARYTGEKIPDVVIQGYKKAAGLADSAEPMDMFKKTTFWRCMGGKVYACNVGANLPCEAKANTDKTPTQAMQDFCKANPGSDFIPMAVTGHETIYSWHCVKDTAEVLEQLSQVDAAGYQSQIWYAIAP